MKTQCMSDKKDRQTILVVDDVSENIDILGAVLRPEYKVKVALSGERALKIAAGNPKARHDPAGYHDA